MASLPMLSSVLGMNRRSERQATGRMIDMFGVKTASDQLPVSGLSGGNQQKVVLGKWFMTVPTILLLDEPTRGVDVGAKREIYHLIQQLASRGLAVIVISSELMELIGLCHRVVVMRAGRLMTTLQDVQLTEEELIAHATGTR